MSSSAGLSDDCFGKFQYQLASGGAWTDFGTEQGDGGNSAQNINEPPLVKYSGSLSFTQTKTGLTASTAYNVRFAWRDDGQRLYRSGGNVSVAGS